MYQVYNKFDMQNLQYQIILLKILYALHLRTNDLTKNITLYLPQEDMYVFQKQASDLFNMVGIEIFLEDLVEYTDDNKDYLDNLILDMQAYDFCEYKYTLELIRIEIINPIVVEKLNYDRHCMLEKLFDFSPTERTNDMFNKLHSYVWAIDTNRPHNLMEELNNKLDVMGNWKVYDDFACIHLLLEDAEDTYFNLLYYIEEVLDYCNAYKRR